jgi:hypothetical protein
MKIKIVVLTIYWSFGYQDTFTEDRNILVMPEGEIVRTKFMGLSNNRSSSRTYSRKRAIYLGKS